MSEKNGNWVEIKENGKVVYYIPSYTWHTFKFQVAYYPDTKVLQLEENDKYFDDHAVIQLFAADFVEAEHLLEHVISVMTI
jgi:hypothetical protein